MDLDYYLEQIDYLDELLDQFILNLPQNFDQSFYERIIDKINGLEREINDSELSPFDKVIAMGMISSMLEYTVALVETF